VATSSSSNWTRHRDLTTWNPALPRRRERRRQPERTDDEIVVPFTTSIGENQYPSEVFVSADESPFREDALATCPQLRTVSLEHRILDNLGSIPEDQMDEVDIALEYSLGLRTV
jgi:mRNA interferase MazF